MIRFLIALLLCLFAASAQARVVPAGDVTMYVATTGSDTTGDGSVGNPFLTPQHAADVLYSDYDFACKYKATIQLAVAPPGSQFFYPGLALSGRLIGQCGSLPPLVVGPGLPVMPIGKYLPFTLQGDPANPMGAFLNPGAGGRPAQPALSLTDGAALRVVGIALDTTLVPQDDIDVFGAFLAFSNVWFGNAGTPGMPGGFNHLSCAFGAVVVIAGDYGMSGTGDAHMDVGQGCYVYPNNNLSPTLPIHVTINSFGSPAPLNFPWAFVLVDNGELIAGGIVYDLVGSTTVTGPTAWVLRNGVIQTTGGGTAPHGCSPTFFPGNSAPIIQDNAVCR